MTSCGSKTSTQQTEPSSSEQMAVDTSGSLKTVAALYQCPMKCEGEKTYDKPGTCPVCKMDLKEKDKHKDHKH
ncbi:MAG: hypothetical protein H7X99_07945 [Saprospiraceae bacterium]|nr:hypothetical protein [Saprospiraceae bacterium]